MGLGAIVWGLFGYLFPMRSTSGVRPARGETVDCFVVFAFQFESDWGFTCDQTLFSLYSFPLTKLLFRILLYLNRYI